MAAGTQDSDSLAAAHARMPAAAIAGWLIVIIAAALISLSLADPAVVSRQVHDLDCTLEWIGSGVTAVAAIVATFRIHVRGRTPLWRAVPVSLFAVWQFVSVHNSLHFPLEKPAEQILYGDSPHCFLFILAVSIPLAVGLFAILWRIKRVLGPSVAPMGGLSIAATAGFLLQFFHASDMNFGDWSIHFLAYGIVVGSCAYLRHLLPNN